MKRCEQTLIRKQGNLKKSTTIRGIMKNHIGFDQLLKCISCQSVCPTMEQILRAPTTRRVGMTSEYDRG